MKKIIFSFIVTLSFLPADGSFGIGSKHFGFGISTDGDYTVMNGNINYLPLNNLSVGIGFTSWIGSKPNINRISLPVTYYMPTDLSIRPYAGLFTSYTFMGDNGEITYENYSSFGGRVGIALQTSNHMYTYAGWVQTRHNTNEIKNNDGYPEFGLTFIY